MPLSHTVQSIHDRFKAHFPIGLVSGRLRDPNKDHATRYPVIMAGTHAVKYIPQHYTLLGSIMHRLARHHLGVKDTCCDISVGYSSVAATTWPDHIIETVMYLQ